MGDPRTLSAEAWPSPGCLLLWDLSRKSSIDLLARVNPRRLIVKLADACAMFENACSCSRYHSCCLPF